MRVTQEINMTRILTILALLVATPVMADYAHPDYSIVLQEGDFAIRDYAPVMVVETQVTASRRDAPGDAFRKLARYIGGKNNANLDIPMTAPVAQTPAAPSAVNGAPKWRIQFFLPRDLTVANTPSAIEAGVEVRRLEAQTFASLSFRGSQTDKKVSDNMEKLKGFIARQGYGVSGPPIYAFYDPPFIPWFLRDNEILLPIERVE
jgi:hypothetical protein